MLDRHDMEQRQARTLKATLDAQAQVMQPRPVPSPEDLRGIPAIGRGVAGVSPGTSPAAAISRLDRERERRARADVPVEPMVAYG